MPYGQSPWAQDAQSINNVGSSMARVAMARMQMQQRQQAIAAQLAMHQAQIQAMEQQRSAQAGLETQKAQSEQFQRETAMDLGRHIGEFDNASTIPDKYANTLKYPRAGDQAPGGDLVRMVVNRIMQDQGRLAGMNPANIGQQVPEIMAMRDPRMRQLMATKTPMQTTLQPGGTVYDNVSQHPVYTAPMSDYQQGQLNVQDMRNQIIQAYQQGQLDVQNRRTDITQAKESSNLLTGDEFETDLNRIKGGLSYHSGGETVRVINPQGKNVRIPKVQLQDALSTGYKLNQ